jgi:hypothetical protein
VRSPHRCAASGAKYDDTRTCRHIVV